MKRRTIILAIVALTATAAACEPTTPATPAPRLIIWADSHGDEPTDWPTLIGCADTITAHIGWAIADRGPISPPPLIDQVAALTADLHAGDRVVIALGSNDLIDYAAPFAPDVRADIEAKVKAKGAVAVWATLPPIAALYMSSLDNIAAVRRHDWNQWVRSLPSGRRIDIAAPLGDTLDASEDAGDRVHLTTTAQKSMATAAAALCP